VETCQTVWGAARFNIYGDTLGTSADGSGAELVLLGRVREDLCLYGPVSSVCHAGAEMSIEG